MRSFSEITYFSALALQQLGRHAEAKKLFRELLKYAEALEKTTAKIDYFATSLPAMLLFEDDLQARQQTTALFLQAQARLGLDQTNLGKALLQDVLKRDPNHAMSYDLWNQINSTAQPKPRAFDDAIYLQPMVKSNGNKMAHGSGRVALSAIND